MNRPKHLTNEAREFWDNHAKRLQQNGLLTEADRESFILVCEIWKLLRNCDQTLDAKSALRWQSLVKQYVVLARQFGLLPKDRIKMALIPDEKDEFGI